MEKSGRRIGRQDKERDCAKSSIENEATRSWKLFRALPRSWLRTAARRLRLSARSRQNQAAVLFREQSSEPRGSTCGSTLGARILAGHSAELCSLTQNDSWSKCIPLSMHFMTGHESVRNSSKSDGNQSSWRDTCLNPFFDSIYKSQITIS